MSIYLCIIQLFKMQCIIKYERYESVKETDISIWFQFLISVRSINIQTLKYYCYMLIINTWNIVIIVKCLHIE